MIEVLNLAGYIRGITYQTFLEDKLEKIDFDNFDVNQAKPFGLIKLRTHRNSIF